MNRWLQYSVTSTTGTRRQRVHGSRKKGPTYLEWGAGKGVPENEVLKPCLEERAETSQGGGGYSELTTA